MSFRARLTASLCILALGGSAVLAAQTPAPSAGAGSQRGPGRMQAMVLEGITLTPAQQAKVDSITASYRAQMPQFTRGTPPSEADRQSARTLMMASVKDVRAVLTPEQQVVYDKNVAALQQRLQQMRQGGGSAPATPAAGPPPQ